MLTNQRIKGLKGEEKTYRVSDKEMKGLSLEVRPNGSKYWRLRFVKADGKPSMLSLGEYPVVTLAKAREAAMEKKRLIHEGMPVMTSENDDFNSFVYKWLERHQSDWSSGYHQKVKERLELNVLPFTQGLKIQDLKAHHLLSLLERIEKRGANNTAHKVFQYLSKILSWAKSSRKILFNPVEDIKGYLKPLKKKPYPAPTDLNVLAGIIHNINSYTGSFITTSALKLLTLTMLRPGEVRNAEWSEIKWEEELMVIPGAKMKMRKDHLVPLSQQSIAILKEIYPLTGKWKHIFPSEKYKKNPISEATLINALRRMGYSKEELVAHSFRSISSTLLNENNWHWKWVETQLAHVDSSVAGIYNRAKYLDQRRRMLQAWADFLDHLHEGEIDSSFLRVENYP